MKRLFFRSSDFLASPPSSEVGELLAREVGEGSDALRVAVSPSGGGVMSVDAHQVGREDTKAIFKVLSDVLISIN